MAAPYNTDNNPGRYLFKNRQSSSAWGYRADYSGLMLVYMRRVRRSGMGNLSMKRIGPTMTIPANMSARKPSGKTAAKYPTIKNQIAHNKQTIAKI